MNPSNVSSQNNSADIVSNSKFKEDSLFNQLCKSGKFHLIFLVIFCTVLFFAKSWNVGLANYDDCYYAQKAKEILETGNWWTMNFAGEPRFDNPPMYMWLTALSFLGFGINDYAARFPCQLMGVLSVIAVYFLAKRLFKESSNASWIAAFSSTVLATSYMFIRYSRHAMVDTTLAFFTILAFLFLLLALEKDKRFWILWGLSVSACILTKSVLGLFPFFISGLYLLLSGNWKSLFYPLFLFGVLEIIVLGFYWHIHQYYYYGEEFFQSHFGWLIFSRGLQKTTSGNASPLFYFKDLAIFFWPWLPIFAFGLFIQTKQIIQRKNQAAFLLITWFLVIFGVMSIMKTQSKWYVLSAYPAIAIITGYALNNIVKEKAKLLLIKTSVVAGGLLILLLAATPLQIESKEEVELRELVPIIQQQMKNKDTKLIGYGFNYHDVNNALLWYSGYSTTKVIKDPKDFKEYISNSDSKELILLPSDKLKDINNQKQSVLKSNWKYTLLAN